ncbi:MAG: Stp1/IreP family PP2C-type Ser/Thr phosphatase [Alistipes sp.]|nr:Stp1/IreP family PP2C-type Ser/Thr phosphatase [Alistipes sp.]
MGLTTICENNFYHEENVGNVRKAQEDSHDHKFLTPNGDLFVVCDGMGGHVGGKKASSLAVSCIIEYLNREEYLDIPAALDAALQYANMQILGYAQTNPEFRGMGTTACIVLLQGDKAYIAHVGDSRIYLHLGKEKQLHRVTKDESFVQKLVDIGEITDDEAETHPNKNRILNALGIKPNMMTNFQVIEPKNGDTFMICSDGLNGMVKDTVIEQCLNSDDIPLETKGKSLINMALQNGGLDNVTVELIHIDNSPHKKSIFISYNPQSRKSKGGKSPKDSKKKNLLITWLTIILSVVLLALSAFAVYVFMNNSEEEEKVVTKEQQMLIDKINDIRDELETLRDEEKDIKEQIIEDEDAKIIGITKDNFLEEKRVEALYNECVKPKSRVEYGDSELAKHYEKWSKVIIEREAYSDSLKMYQDSLKMVERSSKKDKKPKDKTNENK